MEALAYEYLLRGVYQCSRSLSNGADADIYRDMETAHRDLETKVMFTTQDQREYQYRKTFAAVRMNTDRAISEGVRSLKNRLSKDHEDALRNMNATLTIDFYDKDQLDKIIREAADIFHEYGLNI